MPGYLPDCSRADTGNANNTATAKTNAGWDKRLVDGELGKTVSDRLGSVRHYFTPLVFVMFGNDSGAIVQQIQRTPFAQRKAEALPRHWILHQVLVDRRKQIWNTGSRMRRNEHRLRCILASRFAQQAMRKRGEILVTLGFRKPVALIQHENFWRILGADFPQHFQHV